MSMVIKDVTEFREERGEDYTDRVPAIYRQFREGEGIPIHTGLYLENVYEAETAPWERTGERGALINLFGMEGMNDIHLHELTPNGETTLQHHLYDEIVYVAEGNGITIIGEGENKVQFEWEANSLFYLPRSSPYRHINTSPDEPARLLAGTGLPTIFMVVRDADLIFNPPYNYWENISDEEYYSSDGTLYSGEYPGVGYSREKPNIWDANFIPDAVTFDKLDRDLTTGVEYSNMHFPFPDSPMEAHVGEFPVGTYKTAHRHAPGAALLFISGEGYSLMWLDEWEDDAKVKFDWEPGTLIVPPTGWYHHHFNTSTTAARDFVFHPPHLDMFNSEWLDGKGTNRIMHAEEDAEVRAHFDKVLDKKGRESKMPIDSYMDADYTPDN